MTTTMPISFALARRAACALALLAALSAAPGLAQDHPHGPPPAEHEGAEHGAAAKGAADDEAAQAPGGGILGLLPPASSSEHSLSLGGKTMRYRATAGTLPIRDGSGKTLAKLFYVAYTALPEDHERPLTFAFNGGPGAAAAYLNLGALGPKTLVLKGDGSLPPPPSKLQDNPDSWLAFTDLVFVDPVGTGYSRAASPEGAKDFYSVSRDTDTMAAFIRLYVAQKRRATSPLYLAGESYGGFRAAKLARALPRESGIGLKGVVLVSPALEFSLLSSQMPGPVMSEALDFPSMAAVNLYDKGARTREDLEDKLAGPIRFAMNDYLTALAAGPLATRARSTEKVAAMTGLPAEAVREQFGQISTGFFIKNYRAQPGSQLSRYDGTVRGPDTEPQSSYPHGPDAVLDRTVPVFTAAFVDYVRGELGYETPVTYRLLEGDVSRQWDWGLKSGDQGYPGAMEDLHAARALNPKLKVLIASGYTDLVTPFMIPRFLVDQMPPLADARPIEIEDYLGGHMMYLRKDSRHALAQDAAAFYGSGE